MPDIGLVTGAGRGMGLDCARLMTDTVDHLVLVDLDESTVTAAAQDLIGRGRATIEPVVLDITDTDGLQRLADRLRALGRLRSVAHAAGISPTMADWRRMFTVDLVGTASLAEVLRPLATTGTAMVCFASMAGVLIASVATAEGDAVLDDPLHPDLLDRVQAAFGDSIEDPGVAYAWAKRGVHRFVRKEAARLGQVGARICSISPGVIDTPMGRQEFDAQEAMRLMVEQSALRREGRSEELASVAAFLLSDAASYMTGVDVLVDGGVCSAMGLLP